MARSGSASRLDWWHPTPPVVAALVLVASLGVTFVVWSEDSAIVEEKLQANFDFRVRDAERRIVERVKDHERTLRGVAGLFAAASVDRASFGRYVSALRLHEGLPGIQAVGFQQLVPARRRDEHVAAIRSEGLPDYSIRPEGSGETLAPVVFIEPFEGANVRVLGFDPLAEPTRREALERARDAGAAVLSAKVTLVQESGAQGRPGAILYLPVYGGGGVPGTVEERRARILGWVYLAFRVEDFMAGLLGERASDLDLEILDGATPASEGRIYDPDGVPISLDGRTGHLQTAHPLTLAGRTWTLVVRSTGRFEQRLGADRPRFVAVVGVTASLLLAALVMLLSTRAAGRKAREAAAYTRSLIEASLDPLVTIGKTGRIADVNAATEAVTGLPRDRLVGTDFADYFTEPDRARAGHEMALKAGVLRDYALTVRHASGRTTDVIYNATVYGGPDGEVQGVFAAARDVTELRALQAQLGVASRLASLGTLVGGVAHEINNPLAAAIADVELAVEEVREIRDVLASGAASVDPARRIRRLDEVIEELQDAREGARRIARIVQELKLFAAPADARENVRLAEVAEKAVRWLPTSVHAKATVRVEDGGAPDVLASFGQLEQVVVNLLTNAAKATRPGQPNPIVVRVGPGPAGMARLEVADQGTGIEPRVLDRIFDPFFTTREVGSGMGLGLAVCHSIITAHGGTITVRSEVGKGSTFRVELPAAPAEA